jgi:hypothetical protein
MPKAKEEKLSDAERAKRLRETAREVEADATQEEFERAFRKIVPSKKPGTDHS